MSLVLALAVVLYGLAVFCLIVGACSPAARPTLVVIAAALALSAYALGDWVRAVDAVRS